MSKADKQEPEPEQMDTVFFKITTKKHNDPVETIKCNKDNTITFFADIAIPTDFVECEVIGGEKYYGQYVLILIKEST